MANKNDFTPEEWTKVLESIIAAGIAVSAVDPSGWWGTLKEAAAGTPALAAVKRDPNSNELIKAAVADFERSNDGSILAMRERFAQAEPTECVQRSLASLREVSAIVDAKAYDDILSAANRKAALDGQPSGLSAARMKAKQFDALRALAELYADNLPDELAKRRREQIDRAGRDTYFAWAGGINQGDPHYYRIQTTSFLIEFDNTQDNANHIHSVWRDLLNDFGGDLLRTHYNASHHRMEG